MRSLDEAQRNPGLYRSEQLQALRRGTFAFSAPLREKKQINSRQGAKPAKVFRVRTK